MSILVELCAIIVGLNIPVEIGAFFGMAPDEYVTIIPLTDEYQLFKNDRPGYETQEARLFIYSKTNYLALKQNVLAALLKANFTITSRQYIGLEVTTGHHHYAIDTAKVYPIQGNEM